MMEFEIYVLLSLFPKTNFSNNFLRLQIAPILVQFRSLPSHPESIGSYNFSQENQNLENKIN